MGKTRITFLLALGASLWGASATEPPKPEAEASATVTVTAEADPVEITRTPNPVRVIDESAIKAAGSSNLADLMINQDPGTVSNYGGVGTSATIALGAGRPRDTAVTLDGLRMLDATSYGGAYANLMNMNGIARVEIQQGPASTRFGSDAMGGAVAMYSSGSPNAGFSGEVLGAIGNQGILRGGLQAAYGWEKGWVRMALAGQREDEVLDPPHQYRSTGTFLGLGRQAGDDTLITVNYYNNYAAVPTPISFSGVGSSYNTWVADQQNYNRTQILDGTVRTQFTPVLSGELTLGQVLQNSLLQGMGYNVASYSPFDSRRNQMVGHITWQPSATASLVVGVDGSQENARVPDLVTGSGVYGNADHMAVLAEGQGELVHNLRVVGSVRVERDNDDLPGGSAGRTHVHTNETTAKLGVNWILPQGFRAFANAGTGFSSAPLYDSIYNFQYGGEQLGNEKSHAAQVGLDFASGPWKCGLVLSRTLFSSIIYFDSSLAAPSNNYYGLYANGRQVRIQSAELRGGYEKTRWGLSGFYRNQETRDTQAAEGKQLISSAAGTAPFQTLGLRGFRVLGDLRLDVRWSWIGSRYQYGGSSTRYAFDQHYNDLGFSAAWAVREDLTLTLRGDNLMQPKTSQAQWQAGTRLLENDASVTLGYPAQPPTVNLEARYRF